MFIGFYSCRAPESGRPLRRLASGIAVALALGAGMPHAWAAGPLSFDQALRLAQDRSRLLVAQDAAASAARDMAVAAGQRPDPTLKAGINNLPVNGPDRFSLTRDSMTMRSVGVTQEFTRTDKLQARSARFEKEAEAAEAGKAVALANLQRDTAAAWLDRYFQERLRAVLREQRDEARLQIEAADAAYRGGKGSQADVFGARSAAAQLDDRLAQVERQIATATTALQRWIGEPALQALGDVPPLDRTPLSLQDLQSNLAHHPQIQLMVKQEEAAQAEADLARANRKADWTGEIMYSQRGPAYSNMLSVNVSVPLQWDRKNRQDRELAAKLSAVERLQAEREETTRVHVSEAAAMLQEWRSDRERLARYDAALLPLASQRTQAALAAYRGGSASLSSVLDARRGEIDVRIERIRLDMEAARLWAQLNYLIPAGHPPAAAHP